MYKIGKYLLKLAHRLGLHRVDVGHRHLAIHADDARDARRVVDFRDQVYALARDVPDRAGEVVDVVVEGSGGVNAYINKNTGAAEAVIRCMVNSLEFGGKPTSAGIPTSNIESNIGYTNPLNNPSVQNLKNQLNLELNTNQVGGVTFEGVDGDLPF